MIYDRYEDVKRCVYVPLLDSYRFTQEFDTRFSPDSSPPLCLYMYLFDLASWLLQSTFAPSRRLFSLEPVSLPPVSPQTVQVLHLSWGPSSLHLIVPCLCIYSHRTSPLLFDKTYGTHIPRVPLPGPLTRIFSSGDGLVCPKPITRFFKS